MPPRLKQKVRTTLRWLHAPFFRKKKMGELAARLKELERERNNVLRRRENSLKPLNEMAEHSKLPVDHPALKPLNGMRHEIKAKAAAELATIDQQIQRATVQKQRLQNLGKKQ